MMGTPLSLAKDSSWALNNLTCKSEAGLHTRQVAAFPLNKTPGCVSSVVTLAPVRQDAA